MELKTCKGCKFCAAVEDDVGNIKYYCDLDNEEIESKSGWVKPTKESMEIFKKSQESGE